MKRIMFMVTILLALVTIILGTLSALELIEAKQLHDEFVQYTKGNQAISEETIERLQRMEEEQSYFILYTLISLVMTIISAVVLFQAKKSLG